MKDLLTKLIRSTLDVYLKSGEKMESVVIEAIVKNVAVANYNGRITFIEIPHIAYVSAEKGVMEVMDAVYTNQRSGQHENKEKSDGN